MATPKNSNFTRDVTETSALQRVSASVPSWSISSTNGYGSASNSNPRSWVVSAQIISSVQSGSSWNTIARITFAIPDVPTGTYNYNLTYRLSAANGNFFQSTLSGSISVICLDASISNSSLTYDGENWVTTVTVTTIGGTAPFSYAWSGVTPTAGGTTSDNYATFALAPGSSGTASVTVTDSSSGTPCAISKSKSITAPGDGDTVPPGWYCVNNTGCVYIGVTNEGLVTGVTGGPFDTYGTCIGDCNPIGPYCPEGWMWNGTSCVWVGEGDPPEGPAPGAQCGSGYYFNGTTCISGSGPSGSGTGTGSGSGSGTGGTGSGSGTGIPPTGSGSGTGTGSGSGGVFQEGYYCLTSGGGTTCEYIDSQGEYGYYIAGGFTVTGGPFLNCDPCLSGSSGSGTGSGSGSGTGSGSGGGSGTGSGGSGSGTGTGSGSGGDGSGSGDPVTGDDCAARVGIKYRELNFELDAADWTGYEVHKLLAMAVEARSDCTNEACRYNVQLGVIGNDDNDGDFSEEAWEKFQIALPSQGAHYGPPDVSTYREQKFSPIQIPNPTLKTRLRIRFSPIYELWPLETDSEAVVKLRPLGTDGTLMVWTSGPAKMFIYTPPEGRPEIADLIGPDRAGTLGLVFDGSSALLDIADATDAALLENKAYVVTGDGALLVVDTDSGDEALTVKPRREEIEQANSESNRIAKFAEAVNLKPLVIWEDAALSEKATRLYDYSFPAPKLAWESDLKFGVTQVAEGTLYLGTSTKLYSSAGGTAAPVLERNFSSIVTSIARSGHVIYVGLNSGAVWKRSTPSSAGGGGGGTPTWALVKNLGHRVSSIGVWQGGAAQDRGILGFGQDYGTNYEANRMWSENSNGSWVRDRQLPIPDGFDVDGILVMQRSVGPSRNTGTPNDPNQAEDTQIADSMVIGTTGDGLLYVYTRSHLDARYGAFEACSLGVPRMMPVWRQVQEVEE